LKIYFAINISKRSKNTTKTNFKKKFIIFLKIQPNHETNRTFIIHKIVFDMLNNINWIELDKAGHDR
jgi:hypothetical protein